MARGWVQGGAMSKAWDSWRMSFRHDTIYDVVEARFEGVELLGEADVLRWKHEVERHLSAFGKKVYLLIDLRGLMVRPAASTSFGRHRTEVLQRFTEMSFRYNGDLRTRASVSTSHALYNAPSNMYGTREEALAALLSARRQRLTGNR